MRPARRGPSIEAVRAVLPYAVAVAVVPIPVIGMIVILFSRRAKTNGPTYLVGWVAGLAGAFAVLYALEHAGDLSPSDEHSDEFATVHVLLGLALLAVGVRIWRKRPKPGVEPELPRWLAGVDAIGAAKALALGVALAALNPKNLIIVAAAATSLARSGVPTADAVTGLVAFVVVGSLTVAAPLVYYLVGGEQATRSLDRAKNWLARHNATVVSLLFFVFGALVVADGLG